MARRDLTGAVDFAHLEAYVGNAPDVVEEVLVIFLEQAAMWRRMLDPAGEAGLWRDGAHTLKGAALGIGANALAGTCGEAETRWQENAGMKAVLLDRLTGALDQVTLDIAAYRHEQALKAL